MNHHLIVLKTFINDYTSLYYDKKLKLVKTEKRKPKYLTLAQIQTALKYVDDKTDELIIKLLATTGLRINEALKITKKELKNTDENGNALITIVGKNNKRRIIVINPQLVKELKSYSKNNKKYVFESRNFQQRSIRNIQYRFNKLARKIDEIEDTKIYSENLKPHNLRHSFAIEALKTNEINYVKEFLGHENISTTQIYTNLKEEVIGRFKNIKIF
jgi:integrase